MGDIDNKYVLFGIWGDIDNTIRTVWRIPGCRREWRRRHPRRPSVDTEWAPGYHSADGSDSHKSDSGILGTGTYDTRHKTLT